MYKGHISKDGLERPLGRGGVSREMRSRAYYGKIQRKGAELEGDALCC